MKRREEEREAKKQLDESCLEKCVVKIAGEAKGKT